MKTLLLIVFIGIIPILSFAQVKMLDLSVMPVATPSVNGDSVQVLIQFKVNDPSLVTSFTFLFGTNPGAGDVFQGTATTSTSDSGYTINYNGRQETVINHQVRIFCILSHSQFEAWVNLQVTAGLVAGGTSMPMTLSR
jgi:hypothetical protein